MNAQRIKRDHEITPAIVYANKQIDSFEERRRLTFSELAIIVEALYIMAGISGSLVFAYALMSRAKNLVLDERGYFTIQTIGNGVDHVIPSFLRDPPFYADNKAAYSDVKQFVPLFALDLGTNTVVLKNTIWLHGIERRAFRLPPILINGSAEDALTVQDNKHAAVGMPIVYMAGDQPRCAILQLPAQTFDKVREHVLRGETTLHIRKPFRHSSHPVVEVQKSNAALSRGNVQAVVGEFWQKFVEYANTVAGQNAKMPKNVAEAITHTLINTQKTLPELSSLLFEQVVIASNPDRML